MHPPNGLTAAQVLAQRHQFGENVISVQKKESAFSILIRQVKNNYVAWFLIVAVLLSWHIGKFVTAYTILATIIIIIMVGFIQEYKAEKAIEALKRMVNPVTVVIRDGLRQEIPSSEVVPGDLILLRTGERIPTDGVLVDGKEIRVDESLLTGESREVTKIVTNKPATMISSDNQLFMGTFVVSGRGSITATHTGLNTQFGKIATMISTAEKSFRLQQETNRIAQALVVVGIIAAVIAGLALLGHSGDFSEATLTEVLILMIAVAVSAFPESFPVVLTSSLALGAYKMAQQNAIIKRMSVIETLGETNVICSDKTGTITTGEMTVEEIWTANQSFSVTGAGYEKKGTIFEDGKPVYLASRPTLAKLVEGGVLCNDAQLNETQDEDQYRVSGSGTETALLVLGAKAGKRVEDYGVERVEEVPFSSDRKMMGVLTQLSNGSFEGWVKGAPEFLIKQCTHIDVNGEQKVLNDHWKKTIESVLQEMAAKRLRVVGLARKESKELLSPNELLEKLTFLGLVGMEDPPREGVKESILICERAGIEVKMLTGDNAQTARQIGSEVGLNGSLLTGDELDQLSEAELMAVVKTTQIFARVKPNHKLRIMKALKKNGYIVTMTGDGVNDAPALKESDIGVAMGIRGTDVSREASDLILKDDDFSTIVKAIQEGRTIFQNAQKFITYQISCNVGELFLILLGIIIGLPLPLLALQILFMNLVTSDLPAITLGFHPSSKDAMNGSMKRGNWIIQHAHVKVIVVSGLVMGILSLLVYFLAISVWQFPLDEARSLTLFTLICFEVVHAFNMRSFRHPIYQSNFFSNQWLIIASTTSLLATLAIIYTPLNKVFDLAPLALEWLALGAIVSLGVAVVLDIWKVQTMPKGIVD